jgi:DNA-binding response OmpR family regulator
MRILVIDDQEQARLCMAAALEEAGHEVILADGGQAGLKELKRSHVDVVITEVLMPETDGLEIIKAARVKQPELWIVSTSAGGRYLSANATLALARAFGADRVLYKPFRMEDLLEVIARER